MKKYWIVSVREFEDEPINRSVDELKIVGVYRGMNPALLCARKHIDDIVSKRDDLYGTKENIRFSHEKDVFRFTASNYFRADVSVERREMLADFAGKIWG